MQAVHWSLETADPSATPVVDCQRGHATHNDVALSRARFEYLPVGQSMQSSTELLSDVSTNFPAGQEMHPVLPLTGSVYCHAEQAMHMELLDIG